MYRWWVFIHLLGVFAFLTAHGVSVYVTFRVRSERDPRRIGELIELSGSTVPYFWASTGVLLIGGVVAGFLGHWWGRAWIWASLVIFVLTSVAMFGMARPYFRRIRLVAQALADGSQAVTEEQFARILRSRRPLTVAAMGFGGLLGILYLMMFQPSLGFSTQAAVTVPGTTEGDARPVLQVGAVDDQSFSTDRLTAPAGAPFQIAFANEDSGIPHNVAIYTDQSAAEALFVGEIFTGPTTLTYRVPPLPTGTYYYRCDIHPQMNGTLTVE